MDVDVFKQRFLPFHPKLYRIAYALLDNKADAEDILQDAYCKLWNKRDELGDIQNPEAFSITLVKNLCLDFLRSPKASRRDNEEALETVLLTTDSSPEKELEEKEDIRHIQELIEQLPEGLLVSCQKKLTVNGSASCMLQVTAGNILYCWDKATISPAPESGEHAFRITITTRPRINNRRKYPRMDLNNTCTIKFKNSDTEYAATMENISANGFAFLATDKIFTQSKNADVIITIHDFALPNHNVLEGRIIRCSDDNGLYIVGCQMPEDNFYILEYVEKNLNK